MNRHVFAGAGSIAAILAGPYGHRIRLAPPDETGILERLDTHHREVKTALDAAKTTATEQTKLLGEQKTAIQTVSDRVTSLEQRAVQRRYGPVTPQTVGQIVAGSPELKAFDVHASTPQRCRIEVKNITSSPATGTGSVAGMIAPDVRTTVVGLPQRRMTIRDLLMPGTTSGNTIYFPQMTSRTSNAATVAENPSAQKPQSEFNATQTSVPVRTIAHWMLMSKQAFDDAEGLSSLVDAELRYGLALAEEQQILYGDGTGQNLLGILPQATAYAQPPGIVPPASLTGLDKLLMAFAQAELALLPATGVVLNPVDYVNLLLLKDANGRYIGGGPLAALADAFWSVPKVVTPAINQNTFLVGAFRDGAQLFDRQQASVLFSTEDRDNFVKNMVTALGEERVALAVLRPAAFIRGSFV